MTDVIETIFGESGWVHKNPVRGDHIRVCRGVYYHHGIFVSCDEVIHFTGTDDDSLLDWSKAQVLKTDLQQFLRGGTVEVKLYTGAERAKLYPVEDIVEYARDALGDTGYNPVFENCEHFANECAIGEHRSKQVERAKNLFDVLIGGIGGKTVGIFNAVTNFIGGLFNSSSGGGRRPTKTEKVKLAEIERDKQIKLAEVERDRQMNLADKEAARAKIERDAQLKLAEVQHAARMAEAAQREKLAEIERDKQIKLAEVERDRQMNLADKETARAKIERDAQLRLAALENERLQAEHAARMAEAAQQNELQLQLIDKDEERIRLMRDAQAELIKMQTMSQLAIERARVEGMTEIANQLVALQDKMLDVAQKRIAIIEAGALPIVREIENFYAEVGDKITAASDEYNTKKLPQLLKLLGQYERGSTEHEIFTAQINDDRLRQGKFIEQQMINVSERQNLVLQSFLSSKEKILAQTNQIVQCLVAEVAASLSQTQKAQALPTADFKALPAAD